MLVDIRAVLTQRTIHPKESITENDSPKGEKGGGLRRTDSRNAITVGWNITLHAREYSVRGRGGVQQNELAAAKENK